jgi:hypothetical protein
MARLDLDDTPTVPLKTPTEHPGMVDTVSEVSTSATITSATSYAPDQPEEPRPEAAQSELRVGDRVFRLGPPD